MTISRGHQKLGRLLGLARSPPRSRRLRERRANRARAREMVKGERPPFPTVTGTASELPINESTPPASLASGLESFSCPQRGDTYRGEELFIYWACCLACCQQDVFRHNLRDTPRPSMREPRAFARGVLAGYLRSPHLLRGARWTPLRPLLPEPGMFHSPDTVSPRRGEGGRAS